MKKMLIFVLLIVFLGGTAFVPAGSGSHAPPDNVSLQDAGSYYKVATVPPSKICKGDTAPIVVGFFRFDDLDKPLDFIAYTDAGKLSADYWLLPAGGQYVIISTTLTAQNVGKKKVEIANAVDPEALQLNFEVVSCDYDLLLHAIERHKTDMVNWYMLVTGEAVLSSSDEMKSQNGYYHLSFSGEIQDEGLKSGSKGLKCELQGDSSANGEFDVTGSKVNDNIYLSVQFKDTDFGEGVVLYCVDVSGIMGEGITPIFESKTVNPGDSVDVSPNFSKGVSIYKFQFGESGSGTYTLKKRSSK
jgi:hypothetical protein